MKPLRWVRRIGGIVWEAHGISLDQLMSVNRVVLKLKEGEIYSLDDVLQLTQGYEMPKKKENPGWVLKYGSYTNVDDVRPTLTPGLYEMSIREGEKFFTPVDAPSDEAVNLPGLPCEYLTGQIRTFWSRGEVYKKYGFLQKRGILMYGEPGCGKTCIISLLSKQLIDAGGIILTIQDFEDAAKCIRSFREVEPRRPIMTLMEDIEGIFQGDQGNRQIKAALSLLDGQDQTNNIVHVATTNQPELLADRFIKRPGRFDLVIGIHPPKEETRRAYLEHIAQDEIPKDKLKELVSKTEGLSLAYLREIASTFLCLDIPIEDTLIRLKKNFRMKSLKENGPLGFSLGYEGK